MKNDDNKNIQKVLILSILVSSVFHVFVLLSKYDISKFVKKAEPKKDQRVRIVFKNKKKPNQVVNNTKKTKTKKPKDSKFLSHSDQQYDRESVSKKVGTFKEAGKGSKKAISNKPNTVAKSGTPKKTKKLKKKKKKLSFSDLAFGLQKPAKKQVAQAKGLKNGNKKKTGLSQSNDFVEDIPLGDMTKLNTVEYKYYGFYFRIRQRLEQYWGKSLQTKAKKIFRSGRRFPASENHITSLQITLDSKGNIVDVFVKGTSGVSELDDAAVESFNKAGPFPNPPTGLVKNGKAVIEWGFVVKS